MPQDVTNHASHAGDGTPLSSIRKPIAICGMAARLPGGISNPAEFWDFLLAKGDAKSVVPQSRYNISSYYSGADHNAASKTQYGYFLDESIDIGSLDTSFFSFTKNELEYIDPQQRQLLEVVRECFENAGEVGYRGKPIGCYIGSFGDDWVENLFHDPQMYGKYTLMTGGDFALANRISYEYDLRGPSMSIRTACSSTLVCIHEACSAIERGECSAAVVAGCSLIMSPTMSMILSAKGVISSDGSCKTFDAKADGYGRGEAINAVYLKPLEDAIRDGSPIRAVVTGTAINSDGKASGANAPNAMSQAALIRKTYSASGIDDITKTGLVECHGTGTAVGDPVEAAGVASVFGDSGVYMGAVKPNVGHSEGASGLTSLIKTVLSLEHQTIAPNIKFTEPNPLIPFESKNLKVPLEAVPWPQDRCLRASVNAFGMGGVNAHVIVESAIGFTPKRKVKVLDTPDRDNQMAQLLVFSANEASSLKLLVDKYKKYLQDHPGVCLQDLAYTLGARREHLPVRSASVVDSKCLQIVPSTPTKLLSSTPSIIMAFTGQGAQWPKMGFQLYQCYNVFRNSIIESDRHLKSLPEPPMWSIVDELEKDEKRSNLGKAAYAQPLCTAIQIALVQLLRSLNITPYAVIGHSSGEIAAAYAAGSLTSRQAIITAFYRGVVSTQVTAHGEMVAVGMAMDDARPFLIPGVVMACENSPSSVTISGNKDEMESVIRAIVAKNPDTFVRRLKVHIAYHSHHMKEVGEMYMSLIGGHVDKSHLEPSAVQLFSTVTGEKQGKDQALDAKYWQSNLESPVLFYSALKTLIGQIDHQLLFLEVGPHSALSGPIRETLDHLSRNYPYIPCLVRGEDSNESFLSAMGQLYCQNVDIGFDALANPNKNATILTDLPTYCWNHSFSNVYRPRENKEWLWRKFQKHELLGIRVIDSTDKEPTWRNVLHLEHAPWLRDHKVGSSVVFPAAGYIAMVATALGQVTTSTGTFCLRSMELSTAMVLSDWQSTEILTSLRTLQNGGWYEFIISSHDGQDGWREHCRGAARWGHDTDAAQDRTTQTLDRVIHPGSWYKTLARAGIDYGSAFRGVHELSTSTTQRVATGKIAGNLDHQGIYQMHPARIDGFFQTILAAIHRGLDWEVESPHVPVSIGELDIRLCPSDLSTRTWVTRSNKDTVWAEGVAFGADGDMVLRLSNAVLRLLRTNQAEEGSQQAQDAARLYWAPDMQFQRMSSLFKTPPNWKEQAEILSCLTSICVGEALARLRDQAVSTNIAHLAKFQDWLQRQPQLRCEASLRPLATILAETPAASCANAMLKVLESIVPLFRGETSPLEVLMDDGTLHQLYNYINTTDCAPLFQLLGHACPRQRILEIGAGTGGTTANVLQHTQYSSYTFTDISAAFFPAAKERFKKHPNLIFKTLDISKDPSEQGFDPESFDLIIAANVLHATPSLHETLVHAQKLLRPRGKLFLQELCTERKFINFITGILSDWWAGEADGRPDEPYVSLERWDQELTDAGFSGLADATFDAPAPYQINANILARRRVPTTATNGSVLLICDQSSQEIATQFQSTLQSRGYTVSLQALEDPIPRDQNVMVLVDAVHPFFHPLGATNLATFQSFLNNLQTSHSRALWVTRSCQMNCNDPRFGLALGALRTARSELGLDIATCEMDTIKETTISAAADVFEEFATRHHEETGLSEQEYVIVDGVVHIGRIAPVSTQQELRELGRADGAHQNTTLTLDVESYGLLDSLVWKESAAKHELENNQVEVAVEAAGMNFKDLLIALRTIELPGSSLGLEAAGVVLRVGPHVQDLTPGDRVFIVGSGCFSTTLVVSSARCAKIPDSLVLQDAATMPLVFSTVIYSLLDIARLKPSQTILIHSACGGVGLAAIQVSRMVGATIYATVGSEEKVEYLVKTYGIPRQHIFHSRSSAFLSKVMAATKDRGVDVVLNSLSGELLQASCRCIAECGIMIDITKRRGHAESEGYRLPLKPNAIYHNGELTDYIELKPAEGKRLLKTIVQFYEQGHIQPIVPVTSFSASRVKDCFRHMQSGQHMGKLRLLFGKSDMLQAPIVVVPKSITFRGDASYLLVGGLGGIGSSLARWMAERGAGHLIFLSRTAGNSDSDKLLFQELRSQGCSITAIQGSVCNEWDVKQAISAATTACSLKGIFNISMVLRDQSILNMSLEEWNTTTEPKVRGSWNLHNASLHHSLDFFVLFSSMCGMFGLPGQFNYASASTFLDSFVQYRQQKKLPASVLDLGAVEGIGFVSKNPHVTQRSKWLDNARMSQKELFNAITLSICHGSTPQQKTGSKHVNACQIMGNFRPTTDSPQLFNSLEYFFDYRLSSYVNQSMDEADVGKPASENKLMQFVTSVTKNPKLLSDPSAGDFVATEIAKWVFDLLMKPIEDETEIDISRSLSDVGLDSLAAVELRSWWKTTLGLEISVLEITSFVSFAAMGQHAIQELGRKLNADK